jgi:MSHA biogenesis protein MshL
MENQTQPPSDLSQALPPLSELTPQVAVEEKLPFETRFFSLSLRSAPLQDIVLGLSRETGLNLVIDKGVNPAAPVSVELKDMPLRKVLELILDPLDYHYEIEGNVLRIVAFETKVFHLNYSLVSNKLSTSVGGDVLGSNSGGGSGGGSGSGGSGGGMTGSVTISSSADDSSVQIWSHLVSILKGSILSAEGRIQTNPMTGTIIITDHHKNIVNVGKYLLDLQKSLHRQVVLEAKILEVTLSHDHQYGVNWNIVARKLFKDFNFSFNMNLSSGSGLTVGVSKLTGDVPITAILDVLASDGTINILSSPRLNVLNNQSAILSVARTIPYLQFTSQAVATNSPVPVYQPVPQVVFAQAGIALGVTPQIGNDGVITLHIVPIISDQVGNKTFSVSGYNFDVPIVNVRETDTIVRAQDGSTVLLGGLIQDKTSDNRSRFPGLGDLPLVGALFGNQKKAFEKVELVIVLTPTIVEQ